MNQKENTENVCKSKLMNKHSNSQSEKRNYIRNLNENVSNIVKDTRRNLRENFKLAKKQNEIKKISNELILYNNPRTTHF